ncbi:MAG TPA: 23S rRNA (guanosine(2251)-2'-O)-methyltransferase RlmB [Steroidobacteraceae bacterium]|nr:23S rRNA (guanosine(2251)-2'-O)-methyltransferase RlmB [Steroidobacteraceae bacterium]
MSGTERIYGLHAVRAVLARDPARVVQAILTDRRDDRRIAEIEALARAAGVSVRRVDAQALSKLAGEGVHQGVVAEVRPMPPWVEDDLLAALREARTPLVLALDGVQDPHNLGACLRTADACGVLAVVVPKDRAVQVNATVRKVAAGAAETTPVVAVTNLSRSLKLLKEAGLWVVGAAGEADQLASAADLTGPLVLVMGAEGSGLRELTRKNCDFLVRLPQSGTIESLNVSVATGMLLYEAIRQRLAGGQRSVP